MTPEQQTAQARRHEIARGKKLSPGELAARERAAPGFKALYQSVQEELGNRGDIEDCRDWYRGLVEFDINNRKKVGNVYYVRVLLNIGGRMLSVSIDVLGARQGDSIAPVDPTEAAEASARAGFTVQPRDVSKGVAVVILKHNEKPEENGDERTDDVNPFFQLMDDLTSAWTEFATANRGDIPAGKLVVPIQYFYGGEHPNPEMRCCRLPNPKLRISLRNDREGSHAITTRVQDKIPSSVAGGNPTLGPVDRALTGDEGLTLDNVDKVILRNSILDFAVSLEVCFSNLGNSLKPSMEFLNVERPVYEKSDPNQIYATGSAPGSARTGGAGSASTGGSAPAAAAPAAAAPAPAAAAAGAGASADPEGDVTRALGALSA
jgi:hypothetical protein